MPGPNGLRDFQQAITEAYDDNRDGVDEQPEKLQQPDLDGVSWYVEEYRKRSKAKGKGKRRQQDDDSGDHDEEEAQGMQFVFDLHGTIVTDSCK
jgi:hypothetical protein